MTVKLKIAGAPPSMKNSRRLVTIRGQARFIRSSKALDWEQGALLQIPKSKVGLLPAKTPLRLTATIFYPSLRQDLDDGLLCDVLQRAGVVDNDRYLFEKVLRREVDKKNPRVECSIEVI